MVKKIISLLSFLLFFLFLFLQLINWYAPDPNDFLRQIYRREVSCLRGLCWYFDLVWSQSPRDHIYNPSRSLVSYMYGHLPIMYRDLRLFRAPVVTNPPDCIIQLRRWSWPPETLPSSKSLLASDRERANKSPFPHISSKSGKIEKCWSILKRAIDRRLMNFEQIILIRCGARIEKSSSAADLDEKSSRLSLLLLLRSVEHWPLVDLIASVYLHKLKLLFYSSSFLLYIYIYT